MDVISVSAPFCRKAGVHRFFYGHDFIDTDIRWQKSVEPIGQLWAVDGFRVVEMRHHQACMYAGIGPACSDDLCFSTQNFRQCVLKDFLYRYAVGLYLPAMIGRAVVSEIDEISLHVLLFRSFQRFLEELTVKAALCLYNLQHLAGRKHFHERFMVMLLEFFHLQIDFV